MACNVTLLSALPVLLALLAYIFYPSQVSFKEECVSGRYSDMALLQRTVGEGIKEMDTVNTEQFLNYVHKAQPLVIRGGAKDWHAFTHWNDDSLSQRFGHLKYFVDFRKKHNTNYAARKKIRLNDFINNYRTKEWYLDSIDYSGELLADMRVPHYLNASGVFESDSRTNLYLSSGDTQCPIHHDGYENLLTVLDGTKEVLLAPPSEAKHLKLDEWAQYGSNSHPGLSPINVSNFDINHHRDLCNVKFQRVTLYPGDTLYIPLFWFHYVYSPPGRNLAVGIWWELQPYIDSLSDMGMWSDEGIPNLMERYKKWVLSRPHPCTLIDCTPLKSDNLEEVMRDKDAHYSRAPDEPLPTSLHLPSGHDIPTIGYGTGTEDGSIADPYNNVLTALRTGYTLIDTAVLYGNEAAVGSAVRDSGLERGEVFIVSKVMVEEGHDVGQLVQQSVQSLGLGYIDLMLIHNTNDLSPHLLTKAWQALLATVRGDAVRSIGLSNAELSHLELVQQLGGVSVVQNLFTPLHYNSAVRNYCTDHGILFMGYGILGSIYSVEGYSPNPLTSHPVLQRIAKRFESSVQLLLLKWAAVSRVVTIARSTDPQHMRDNLEHDDLKLGKEDVRTIDSLYTGQDLAPQFET